MAKPGELKVRFGVNPDDTSSKDLLYEWGGSGADRSDARVMMRAFEDTPVFDGKTLRQVLTERGYDMSTFKFSIKRIAISS